MSIDYLISHWEKSHQELKKNENYRELTYENNLTINPHYDFASNDYLGLRSDSRLANSGYENALKYGSGNGASRSVLQSDETLWSLEKLFCQKTQFEHAIFFPSGFLANISFFDVLSPFLREEIDQEIFIDHRAHASLFYALKNSGIKTIHFRHQDYDNLERKLNFSKAKAKIIVVESLYSMDGDFSSAKHLHFLCKKYNAYLFVDEGHSFGIYGQNGNGWLNEYPFLKPYTIAAMFGCGKAIGVSGGFLATNHKIFYERIIQKSKTLIYSTGISPAITGAVYKALEIIFSPEGDEKRKLLFHNVHYFHNKLSQFQIPISILPKSHSEVDHGYNKNPKYSQIIPIVVGENKLALKLAQELNEKNFLVKAIRPPSVPKGTARLRLTLNSLHSFENLDSLLMAMEQFFLQNRNWTI